MSSGRSALMITSTTVGSNDLNIKWARAGKVGGVETRGER